MSQLTVESFTQLVRASGLVADDLAPSPDEQLGDVVEVLKRQARMQAIEMPEDLRRLLAVRMLEWTAAAIR